MDTFFIFFLPQIALLSTSLENKMLANVHTHPLVFKGFISKTEHAGHKHVHFLI